MADEVIIGNVGGNDGVASEITLQALLRAVEKMGGRSGSGSAAKVQELHNKAVEQGTSAEIKHTKGVNDNTSAVSKSTEAVSRFGNLVGNATAKGLGALLGTAGELAKQFLDGKNDLTSFAKVIPIVGGPLSVLTGLIDENISSFRKLSASGAIFGEGLTGLRNLSAQAAMPLGEFTELIATNSKQIRYFGSDVTSGAENFARLSMNLRKNNKDLMALGFTSQELNQGLIDYAELMQMQFSFDQRRGRVTEKGAKEYLTTLTELSAITGKHRDQLAAELKQNAGNITMQAAMVGMSAEQQKRFQANMATVPEEMKAAFNEQALGQAISPITQGLMTMSATFREKAKDFKNMDPRMANNMLFQVGQDIQAYAKKNNTSVAAIIRAGGPMADALMAYSKLTDKRFLDEEAYAALQERQRREQARQPALKNFSETLNRVRGNLMDVFTAGGENSPLGAITAAFEDVANNLQEWIGSPEFKRQLESLKTTLNGIIKDFRELGFEGVMKKLFAEDGVLGKAIHGALDKMGTWLADAIKSALTSPAVLGTLAAVFAGPLIIKAFTGGIATLFSSVLGSGSAGGGRRGRIGGSGRGVGAVGGAAGSGIGNFIGQMGAGVMRGAAAGLSAFASPQVAIGAVVLAGAIIGIGAAIAGATWLMGAALPKFSEGMKSFENVDGAKLRQAAEGMAGVAGAIAKMGAGAAAGAISNAIANLFEMLPGPTILERVRAISNEKFDTAAVKQNAEAIKAYADAIKDFPQTPGPDVFDIFKQGLAKMMGVDADPWAGLKSFQLLELDKAAIGSNGLAVKAYANAIKDFPTTPAADVFDIFKQGLAKLMGVDASPWAGLVAFSGLDLNLGKITSNSLAVKVYANAIKDFPKTPEVSVFESFKNALASLFGSGTGPFDQLKQFGELPLNADAVAKNAAALTVFSTALKGMQSTDGATLGISSGTVENIARLATLNYRGGLDSAAKGFAAIAEAGSTPALKSVFDSLKGLDNTQLTNYTNSIKELSTALSKLNEEMAKGTQKGWMGGSSGPTMTEVLQKISVNTGSGSQSNETLTKIMNDVYVLLKEMKEIDAKIERNTKPEFM